MRISKKTHFTVASVILLSLLVSWYISDNSLIGLLIGLAYILFFGFTLGNYLFHSDSYLYKVVVGALVLISLFIIESTAVYFLYNLAHPIPFILIILTALLISVICTKDVIYSFEKYTIDKKSLLLYTLYTLGAIGLLFALFHTRTFDAVRGPWVLLTTNYLAGYSLLTLVWLLLIVQSRSSLPLLLTSTVHFFITAGVVLIVFPLGFGFDSFLHRAAENTILAEGAILPKTPYYIGQYALVIILRSLTLIPINHIDMALLPVLFSILAPSVVYVCILKNYSKQIATLALPLLLFIPVTLFNQTTPYGLATLFFITCLAYYTVLHYERTRITLGVFTLLIFTTLSIHPVTGLALFAWAMFLFSPCVIKKSKILLKRKKVVKTLVVFSSIVLFPFVFITSSRLGSPLTARLSMPDISDFAFTKIFFIETFEFVRQYDLLFDFMYVYRYNWTILLLVLGFIGIFLNKKNHYVPFAFFIGFSVMFLNSVFVNLFVSFDSLIFYERTDFAGRLYTLSLLFLLPFMYVTLFSFLKKLISLGYASFIAIVLATALITSAMYMSYPRYDSYELVRTINTSQYDIEAVNAIERDAGDKKYVVLANQAVSAAAVQELGFKRYFNEHFFYPIPTGGTLYQHYLNIVERGSSPTEEVNEVFALTDADTVYLVLNDYWSNALETHNRAVAEKEEFMVLGGGAVTIFKY